MDAGRLGGRFARGQRETSWASLSAAAGRCCAAVVSSSGCDQVGRHERSRHAVTTIAVTITSCEPSQLPSHPMAVLRCLPTSQRQCKRHHLPSRHSEPSATHRNRCQHPELSSLVPSAQAQASAECSTPGPANPVSLSHFDLLSHASSLIRCSKPCCTSSTALMSRGSARHVNSNSAQQTSLLLCSHTTLQLISRPVPVTMKLRTLRHYQMMRVGHCLFLPATLPLPMALLPSPRPPPPPPTRMTTRPHRPLIPL